MKNETQSDDECRFITDFATSLQVIRPAKKEFQIKRDTKTQTQSIAGTRLLVLVYQRNQQYVVAVCPVFNYIEK